MLSSHRGATSGRSSSACAASAPSVGGAVGPGSSSLLEIDPVILIQLLDLKERSSVESLWGLQPRPPVSLLHSPAHAHSRKERERRPQVVRRSAPDSGVLIRLKAQMAEVRSKMADVKSQVLETCESGESRPGPSGGFGMEEASAHSASPELPACHKGDGLEQVGRAAAPRSNACRPTRKSVSPILDSSGGSLLVKRRNSEDMKDDPRGAESAAELSLHPKDGTGAGEGELQSEATSGPLVSLSSSLSDQASTSTKQKCSADKQLYAPSGPRDEIFSLGGPSYITASKAFSGRTLGATVLECELESSRNSHQSLLEEISAPAQSNEDQSSPVLVAATSSDSDTEDEALQSCNSRYDNHTPPCTGEQHLSDDKGLPAIR